MQDKLQQSLLQSAIKARENAYAPYSRFAVGACLRCADGTLYTGCNVENAAYGSTICAERTALCKAVSEGKRQFTDLAVVGSGELPAYPCGACRQMLAEFGDLCIYSANADLSTVEVRMLSQLLPLGFGKEALE